MRISKYPHAIHDVTCLSVRLLSLRVCLCLVSLPLLPCLFRSLPVLCPAHHLQCRHRRGLKPLHSRTMRSIAPWRHTILSQRRDLDESSVGEVRGSAVDFKEERDRSPNCEVSHNLLYWKKKLPTDICGPGGRMTRKQLTSRPDHLWPELWKSMGKNAKLKEKQKWSEEKLHLENARKLRGIYFIDPEDTEFKETIKNARKRLETSVAPAMLL